MNKNAATRVLKPNSGMQSHFKSFYVEPYDLKTDQNPIKSENKKK